MATIFSIFRKSQGLEEIIFQDRNKEYGSYVLRKEQDSTVNKSSLITLGIVSLTCLLLVQNGKHTIIPIVKDSTIVEAVFISPNIETPIISIPPAQDYMQHIKRSDFFIPIIVDQPTEPGTDIEPNPDIDDPAGETNRPLIYGSGKDGQDPVPVEINQWVYNVPEMPSFNGGDLVEFSNWVQRHIVYPLEAIEKDLEGRVTAEFIIGKQGQIEEIKIMKGIDPLLDNEALRVLKLSPLWKPGKQNGDPVRVKLVLPIIFKLSR